MNPLSHNDATHAAFVDKPAHPKAGGILPSSPKWTVPIFFALGLTSLVSLAVAVREAVRNGVDFQWSGAHLLSLHQDPWMTYLSGDAQHQIILGQQPNYLAEFYLLLSPLGRMAFSHALVYWCFVNLILLSATLFMVARLFELNRAHSVLLALLTLSSTPFRVTMSNGQNGIFILFTLAAFYYFRNSVAKGLALGLSYSKYSFSPLLVLVLLFQRKFKWLLISALPPLVGLLIAWRMLGGTLETLALEPFRTAKVAFGTGFGDLMTPLEDVLQRLGVSNDAAFTIPAVAGMIAALVLAVLIFRAKNLDELAQFALIIPCTFLSFKHQNYDYIALLVPIAALMRTGHSRARVVALLCAAYFWFGDSFMHRLHLETTLFFFTFSFILLSIFTAALAKSLAGSRAGAV